MRRVFEADLGMIGSDFIHRGRANNAVAQSESRTFQSQGNAALGRVVSNGPV
jgi:hypothetical protein